VKVPLSMMISPCTGSLARVIKTARIEVASFWSADEFLNCPCLNQVNCAVADVRMPGIDGLALQ
jgi:FixJ family two-component response regulator